MRDLPFLRRTSVAMAILIGGAAAGETPDALWMTRPVPGYVVSLSVQAQPPSGSKGDARHAGDLPHRLRIEIGPGGSQDAIEVYGLSLYVAEDGYSGTTIGTQRSTSKRQVQYEASAILRPATSYRILLRFDPPDGSRTREALFDYRHHH